MDKRIRIEKERTVRETHVTLLQRLEIVFGDRGLADGSGAEVDDLVAVVPDLGVEVGHARLSPVPPNDGKQVTQHIRLGDRPVNIRNDHLAIKNVSIFRKKKSKSSPCQCDATNKYGICISWFPERLS